MGKNEFLTPKAIGNRIKAKGLQKLRWYCQMCQKQCRDENGFKCHQNSESHKRQMEVFGQNPGRVIYGYTEEFEKGFMELLKRAHPNTRVAAKVVYNEYIADRHHVHMNSTKWLTLSEFVQHLGETGQCRIENTPKGWFISLIKEEDKIERERRLKRERAEKGEEERNRAMIESQVKRARTDGAEDVSGAIAGSELQRGKDGEAVRIALAGPSRLKPALLEAKPDPLATKAFAESDRGNRVEGSANGHSQPAAQKRKTAVQAVMEQEEQMKQMNAQRAAAAAPAALLPTAETLKKAGDGPWLHKRIIVKVISKSLRDTAYYKKKALVRKIMDGFIGEVEMLDSGDVLRVDQRELETVLPDIGKPVLVVSGADKGEEAMMKAIHTADFVAEIKLKTGRHAGQSVKLPYESICKLQKS